MKSKGKPAYTVQLRLYDEEYKLVRNYAKKRKLSIPKAMLKCLLERILDDARSKKSKEKTIVSGFG